MARPKKVIDAVSNVINNDTMIQTVLPQEGITTMEYTEVKTMIRTINVPSIPGRNMPPEQMDFEIKAWLDSGWKILMVNFVKWNPDDGYSLLWVLVR